MLWHWAKDHIYMMNCIIHLLRNSFNLKQECEIDKKFFSVKSKAFYFKPFQSVLSQEFNLSQKQHGEGSHLVKVNEALVNQFQDLFINFLL
jgi:hypothetical protein